jgi:PKD repeat protein
MKGEGKFQRFFLVIGFILLMMLLPSTVSAQPIALFTANVTQGQVPLTVQFIDQSVSPGFTSFAWDVNNDGVVDFTTRNPVYTYRAAGTYSVTHTVTNADGADSEIKTNYITVSSPAPKNLPKAQFTANITLGQAPLTVQFTDKSDSSGATSYQWDINNDGVVESTLKNPLLTYTTAGNKTVKITVTNASGSASVVKTDYITVLSVQSGECFGAEACNPTGNPIGGGAGYTRIITETDARVKYVVSTKDQLLTALKSAKLGDVVYVKGDANIDMTGTYGTTIPGGVTLASNRGKDGSAGGRIFQNRIPTDPTYEQNTAEKGAMLKAGGDNVRITGLRLEGPDKTTADLKSMNLGMKYGILEKDYRALEVDNCEIWGWSWAGIALRITTGSDNAYIHHNYIHHCQDSNVGYGVAVSGGTALVEANLFDYTKHSISGSGLEGEGYEARYNVQLSHANAPVFDVHPYTTSSGQSIAGNSYKIHHNTVMVTDNFAVGIRAVPLQGVWIDHNRFQWYNNNGRNEPPAYQSGGSGRIYMTQNLIGPDQVLYPEGPVLKI